MKYQEFRIRVEEMTTEDAAQLLDAIIRAVEAKGLRMGGGYFPLTDADLGTWNQVKGHVRAIWNEVKAWVEAPLSFGHPPKYPPSAEYLGGEDKVACNGGGDVLP